MRRRAPLHPPTPPARLLSRFIEDWLSEDEIATSLTNEHSWPGWDAHQKQLAAQRNWLDATGLHPHGPQVFGAGRIHPGWRDEENAQRERAALDDRVGRLFS